MAVEPGLSGMEDKLHQIYELYVDYVLKNPFYEMEMPIKCDLFDNHVAVAIRTNRSVISRLDKIAS